MLLPRFSPGEQLPLRSPCTLEGSALQTPCLPEAVALGIHAEADGTGERTSGNHKVDLVLLFDLLFGAWEEPYRFNHEIISNATNIMAGHILYYIILYYTVLFRTIL